MEPFNWLPVIAAGASLLAVIRFWVDLGKVWRQAEDAAVTAAAMAGKVDILRAEIVDHRVEVASNYTTNSDLKAAIEIFTKSVDKLDSRLESYMATLRSGQK